MLEASGRLATMGISFGATDLPKAPAGVNEQNMNRVERQLLDGGLTPAEVDAKMRHIVLVCEAEAIRERHRRWFKPALIWDPERAARSADTSLEEAARPRAGPTRPDSASNRQPERPNLMKPWT
jgi:hypothetical protein